MAPAHRIHIFALSQRYKRSHTTTPFDLLWFAREGRCRAPPLDRDQSEFSRTPERQSYT